MSVRSWGGKFVDLTGMRFGQLTVLRRSEIRYFSNIMWECECDCGEKLLLASAILRRGQKSCIKCCHKRESAPYRVSETHIYKIWQSIKSRCFRKSDRAYRYYGGRGIVMCDEWKNDFFAFQDWIVGHGYKDDLTIDRIDNNGNYCPGNCRFVTMKEQSRNKRNNIFVEHDGEVKILSDWAKELGMSKQAMFNRFRSGWNMDRLFKPLNE